MENKNVARDIIKFSKDAEISHLKEKIKQIELEFDAIEEKIKQIEEEYNKDSKKIYPFIEMRKDKKGNDYNYLYLRVYDKKWYKNCYDSNGIDFSNDDLLYLASKIDSISIQGLNLVMEPEQFDTLMQLVKLSKYYKIFSKGVANAIK